MASASATSAVAGDVEHRPLARARFAHSAGFGRVECRDIGVPVGDVAGEVAAAARGVGIGGEGIGDLLRFAGAFLRQHPGIEAAAGADQGDGDHLPGDAAVTEGFEGGGDFGIVAGDPGALLRHFADGGEAGEHGERHR